MLLKGVVSTAFGFGIGARVNAQQSDCWELSVNMERYVAVEDQQDVLACSRGSLCEGSQRAAYSLVNITWPFDVYMQRPDSCQAAVGGVCTVALYSDAKYWTIRSCRCPQRFVIMRFHKGEVKDEDGKTVSCAWPDIVTRFAQRGLSVPTKRLESVPCEIQHDQHECECDNTGLPLRMCGFLQSPIAEENVDAYDDDGKLL